MKNISINELFENTYVISIDKQKLSIFNQIFKIEKFPQIKLFSGYTDPDLSGNKKCGLTHVAIIKMAIAQDLPFVCIFEDDAFPCIDAFKLFSQQIKNIPDNCKLFILGYCNNIKQNNNILTGQCKGSHAYIIFKSGYNAFLAQYNKHSTEPIDKIFSYINNNDVFVSKDNLFIQYSAQRSMHKHIGYIYNDTDNKNPPPNFNGIEYYLLNLEEIKNFISQYKLQDTHNKCILIGSNIEEIKKFKLCTYIDKSYLFKIRLNDLPKQQYIKNYGKRTGLFFCDSEHTNELKKHGKKFIKIYQNNFMSKYSFDFLACLLCINNFNYIETFGINISYGERQILNKIINDNQYNCNFIDIAQRPELYCQQGITNYINKKLLTKICESLNLKNIQDILLYNRHATLSSKCILIGGAPSVKIHKFQQYIDSENATIIRVNTSATLNDYEKYVGTKTDLIIASSWHKNNNIIIKNESDNNITVYLSDYIRKLFPIKKPTTGFMALIICMHLFDQIELLGFGFSNQQQAAGICDSIHNIDEKTQINCVHNLNYEHKEIDKLIEKYPNKIKRLEDAYN